MLKYKKFITLTIVLFFFFSFFPDSTMGAYSPHSVPNEIWNHWNDTYGGKNFSLRSGKKLVYDVYSRKYTSGGYRIINRDFGKGNQPYLNFQGWAVIFGHKRHTSNNHETYIVAQKVGSASTVKIYKTNHINISATEDLEYNNQGSGVWNECPADATNKDNQLDCNMRYDNVGFDAYLPLEELFPDPSQEVSWRLYIVKEVDGHIIYTPLILPFEFENKKYNGGTISLSSGVNARSLTMIGTNVIRRDYPRQTAADFYEKYGQFYYFTTGATYTQVDSEESETAVWYGVNYSGSTKWATSAYWQFGGDQAILGFDPEDNPPVHISHSMTSTYQNGNDYWVQPNTNVRITLRQRDPESGNKHQYLRLLGNGQDVRARHDFDGSSSNMNKVGSHPTSTNHLSINSASRTENTQYGTVQWQVTPKTHGHAYSVLYHYVDNAGNAVGYGTGSGNTGMVLRVDGVSPSLNQYTFSGARYVNGSTYWVRSGDSVDITIRQYDGDSGNKYQYLRALDPDGNIVSRSRHDFAGSKSSNNKQITNSNFDIVSANRTENTAYGKIEWTVKPKTHNSSYTVQTYLQDNVNNYRDYTTLGTVKVDDIAPVLNSFQLTGAQYIDGNNYWVQPNRTVKVKIRQYDDASGNKHQYLRLLENGEIVVRSRHDFGSSPDTNIKQVENTNVSIDSAYRSENSAYGTVEWSIRPISHGHNYEVQRYFIDYVSNSRDYVTDGYLRVDGVGPNIYFRNQSDTSDFTGRDWADEDIVVRLKFSDAHSGYKRSRYAWSLSPNTPSESEWSNWTTSSNYLVSQAMKGVWYLHVQAEDFVGNRTTTKSSVYKLNHPPEVILQYEVLPPNPGNGEIFEGDTIKVCVQVHDEDGDLLTVKSYYEKDGKKNYLIEEGGVASGTKLCNTFVADTPGQYNIGASANDGIFQSSASTWINVKSLILKGFVLHTDEWNLFHQQMGHAFNMFYSGEKFMLAANVSPYPIVYVKSMLVANQADGKPINDSVELYKHSNVLYRGELYHEKYTKYPTNIKKGPANFVFEVKYQNGKVKNDTVPIIIIDDVYKPFKFHRKY